MGGDAEFGARLITQALELPLSPEQYLTERVALLKLLFVSVPAMPGAEAWVNALLRANVPVAIGTSSFAELCAIKWSVHSWVESIAVKVCGDDPEVRARKPAPDIFVLAAERLGVAPRECVVFEDSPAGVEAARQAGMCVVAIRAPQLDARHLQDADLIVDGYHQLDMSHFGWAKNT
jgi:pseudouridine-5'-monophosphatase